MSGKVGVEKSVRILENVGDLVDIAAKLVKKKTLAERLGDLALLPGMYMEVRAIADDFEGAKEELKDLDAEEMKQIGQAGIDLVLRVVSKFAGEKKPVQVPAEPV